MPRTAHRTARVRFCPLSTPIDNLPTGHISDETLLAKYDRLIIKVAHTIQESYSLSAEDGEELAQEARIRLLRVPQSKRNVPVWVRVVINNAMRNALAKMRRTYEPLVSLDPGDSQAVDETTTLLDSLEDPAESPQESLERDQLARAAFACLSTEEQLVMAYRLGLDGGRPTTDLRALSRKSGVREARLERIINRSLMKMRKMARVEAEAA